MRRRIVVGGLLVMMTGALLARVEVARAQLPVCPQPSTDQPYYTACAAVGRLFMARLLFDLAIDHVLKADNEPVLWRAADILRAVVNDDTYERNAELRSYLGKLEPFSFIKLDTATGLLRANVPEDARSMSGTITVDDNRHEFTLSLPASISAGYWRTPSVLQIAFWEDQRVRFGIAVPGSDRLEAEVDCLVISTDAIRVVTRGVATPDILVRFNDCDG